MLESVLIAEDDSCLRKYMAITVSKFCPNIDEVDNGRDLVDYIRHGNYSLILTDNNMPEPDDGINAIKEIRKFNPTVLIGMISNGMEKEEAIEAGANWYLEKPYFLKELTEMLKELNGEKK